MPDRKFSGHVKRTARRPAAEAIRYRERGANAVYRAGAAFLLVLTPQHHDILLSGGGAGALAWFNRFMKRYTHLPLWCWRGLWLVDPDGLSAVSESTAEPLADVPRQYSWAVAYMFPVCDGGSR